MQQGKRGRLLYCVIIFASAAYAASGVAQSYPSKMSVGRAKVVDAGYEPMGGSPEDFSALLARDLNFVGRVVKEANVQPTD